MVESNVQIDRMFAALADTTRRDILWRVAKLEMSIGEIAEHYKLTFAAISKHIKVLENANLVVKRRQGKEQIVIAVPDTLNVAREQIERYARLWDERFNNLEAVLKEK